MQELRDMFPLIPKRKKRRLIGPNAAPKVTSELLTARLNTENLVSVWHNQSCVGYKTEPPGCNAGEDSLSCFICVYKKKEFNVVII